MSFLLKSDRFRCFQLDEDYQNKFRPFSKKKIRMKIVTIDEIQNTCEYNSYSNETIDIEERKKKCWKLKCCQLWTIARLECIVTQLYHKTNFYKIILVLSIEFVFAIQPRKCVCLSLGSGRAFVRLRPNGVLFLKWLSFRLCSKNWHTYSLDVDYLNSKLLCNNQ